MGSFSFFFREQALKKRLAFVHDSLSTALSDSSRRDNEEQIARLTQSHRSNIRIHVSVSACHRLSESSYWSQDVRFTHWCARVWSASVPARPWARTDTSAGSTGSRRGGWSRRWQPWWRVSRARAGRRQLQGSRRNGGGKRRFCEQSSDQPSEQMLTALAGVCKSPAFKLLLLDVFL